MQLLVDGILIFLKISIQVCLFYITSSGLGLLWLNLYTPKRNQSLAFKLTLGLLVGLIPLSLFSYGFIQLARIWSLAFILGSFLLAATGLISFGWNLRKIKFWGASGRQWLSVSGCLILFFLFLSLRLSYLREIVLTPYTDSVEHYRIVVSFLSPQLTPSIFSAPFYHVGFHSLAAWLSMITGMAPENAISVTGQLLLAAFPFSIFCLVHTLSQNWKMASLSALVGAFFWNMPAHAIDWGKFPALVTICLLPATLAFMVILWKAPGSRTRPYQITFTGGIVLAGLTFFHSRMLLVFIIACGCYLIGDLVLDKLTPKVRLLTSFSVLALFLTLAFLNKDLFNQYSVPVFPFILLLLLSAASAFFHPRTTISISLWGILVYLLIFIPVPQVLTKYSSVWMDAPFLQILFSLPFAVLVGMGMAGILEWAKKRKWINYPVMALLACVMVWAVLNQPFRPSNCCNYVSSDDMAAYSWIKGNLPQDAQIAIPGRIDVFPSFGTDGGIWITTLTGRQTFLLPYTYNWNRSGLHEKMCAKGVIYIFYSAAPMSFQVDPAEQPLWYQPLYELENTHVYRVIGCGD
jgi:hypothetical protein